jgi:hypothetical protein
MLPASGFRERRDALIIGDQRTTKVYGSGNQQPVSRVTMIEVR